MTDEALRALERELAARPDDAATRAALAAALVRAGERRRAVALVAGAARRGDAAARALLDDWHPWPGPDGPGGRRAAAAPLPPGLAEGAAAGHPLELEAVLGATASRLLLLGRGPDGPRVLALDPRSLAACWALDAGPAARAALVGEDLVVVSRSRLRTFAPEDGAPRGALTLPAEGRAVAAADDRAVVLLRAPDRTPVGVAAVDLRGEAPALAWVVDTRAQGNQASVHEGRVQVGEVCLRLADGSPAPALCERVPRRGGVWKVAGEGADLVSETWGGDAGGWVGLAGPGGAWEALLPRGVGQVALTAARVVVRSGDHLVGLHRASGVEAWRTALPAWPDRRVAVAAAGDEVLALVVAPAQAALVRLAAADGAPRGEVALDLRGPPRWPDRPAPALVVHGDGALVLGPAPQVGFVHVARLVAAGAPRAAAPRGPRPGDPTPVVGAREAFDAGPGAWRTAEEHAVLPPTQVEDSHLRGATGGWVWRLPTGEAALVGLFRPASVLRPTPALAEVALLVDLARGGVVALPLAGAAQARALVPAGLLLAEGVYLRPGDFRAGGFVGCRLSAWELPAGRLAWTLDLGDAAPVALAPRPDGRLELEVEVALDDDRAEVVRRTLAPPRPGWGDPAGGDVAAALAASRVPWPGRAADPAGGLALRWPAPEAAAVLEVRGPDGAARTLPLAAALPPPPAPTAARGDVAAAWDDDALRVTRAGREVARLALPPDVRPGRVRAPGSPPPRPGAAETQYVLAPPALVALAVDGAHALAVVVPKGGRDAAWTAVVWALDHPEAPLGHVVLGPRHLPPPRAVLEAPPGRLRLDLGRGVALVARLEGPLAEVAWEPTP